MNLNSSVDLYFTESKNVLSLVQNSDIVKLVELIHTRYKLGAKILIAANGGTAGIVDNWVTDLNIHTFANDSKTDLVPSRNTFQAISLSASISTLTGLSNDLGFEKAYSTQLPYLMTKDDLLICVSGSGNSKNMIHCKVYADSIGATTVGISRKIPCALDSCGHFIYIPGESQFPGQTGGNNNNFHFEDFVCKLSHITTGLLKVLIENDKSK